MSQRHEAKILLLDEDEEFGRKVQSAAALDGVELHWHASLASLGPVGRLGDFDVLLVEPQIGPVNGFEIAEYVDAFFPGLPILLLSKKELPVALTQRSKSVTGFISKCMPPEKIIEELGRRTMFPRRVPRFPKLRRTLRCVSA